MGVLDRPARVGDFFSDFSERWDTLYGGKRNSFWRKFDNTFRRDVYERYELSMKALGNDLSGKSILDVGCGSGIYCFEAARRGAAHVLGVDVAKSMIQLARKRSSDLGLEGQCEFVCSEFPPAETVPSMDRQFDYAIVMGVMDYLEDPRRLLGELHKIISDSSVISFPFAGPIRYPLRKYRYRVLGRCPIYHYSRSDVEAALRESGFSDFDVAFLRHSGGCFFVTARRSMK